MRSARHIPDSFARFGRTAGVVGLALSAVSLVGLFADADHYFRAYLYAFLFWNGLGLGMMSLLMIHHLVGGAWGFTIQRIIEAGTRTIPFQFILFIPVGVSLLLQGDPSSGVKLYYWAVPGVMESDHLLHHKAPYLNVTFFLVRSVVYFAIWTVLGGLLTRWSLRQDETRNTGFTRKMKTLAGPGLVLYMFTMTFAAFDWGMSLDPHWFSTIYGVIFAISQGLSALALSIFLVSRLSARSDVMRHVLTADRLHDIGKLLLAFVILWAYMHLSQYLIIYMGNIPEETAWYVARLRGGWHLFIVSVVVLQFALPFLLLLPRGMKRKTANIVPIAILILVMRFVDLYWMIMPAHGHALHLSWVDVVLPVALGGLWVAVYLWNLGSRPLMPSQDPRFKEAIDGVH